MTTAERIGVLLGVLGFLLSLGNLAWTVWAHHVQNRVKLHADVGVRMDRRGVLLIAHLVNDGSSPVFIEQVALVGARPTEGTGGAYPSLIMAPDPVPPGGPKAPLAAGEGRDYILVRHPSLTAVMGDIRNSRQYQYWISVRTPKREVMKINDAAFLSQLKLFAEDDALGPEDFMPPVSVQRA